MSKRPRQRTPNDEEDKEEAALRQRILNLIAELEQAGSDLPLPEPAKAPDDDAMDLSRRLSGYSGY